MKHIIAFLLVLLLVGCSASRKLNKQIDQSQETSLTVSPFKTASGMQEELKIQLEYRNQYIDELKNIIAENKKDTIILTEDYDFICFGCPADGVRIFIQNKEISYRKQGSQKVYIRDESVLEDIEYSGYYQSDLIEIIEEIRKGKQWNAQPQNYGTDECFDGGHTFYTVFFPDGKIESMYMRCWMPKEFRKK